MGSRMKVTVHSNVDEFMEAVVERLPTILKAIGQTAEGYAKQDCPVDTGLLRNSITFAISGEAPAIQSYSADRPDDNGVMQSGSYDGNTEPEEMPNAYSVQIGTNVKYAPAQEFNEDYNHMVGKAHFLRDALQNNREDYKDIIYAGILSLPGVEGGNNSDLIG